MILLFFFLVFFFLPLSDPMIRSVIRSRFCRHRVKKVWEHCHTKFHELLHYIARAGEEAGRATENSRRTRAEKPLVPRVQLASRRENPLYSHSCKKSKRIL